jgi:hypothetical protein
MLLQTHGPFSEKAAAVTIYECLKIISVCHANGKHLSASSLNTSSEVN